MLEGEYWFGSGSSTMSFLNDSQSLWLMWSACGVLAHLLKWVWCPVQGRGGLLRELLGLGVGLGGGRLAMPSRPRWVW